MKKLGFLKIISMGILLFTANANAQYKILSNETTKILNQSFGEKEAAVWYLGSDGFAIRTKNHMLIFIPQNVGSEHGAAVPPDASLSGGIVNPEEIRNLDVVVFSSSFLNFGHGIWSWQNYVNDITYVLGWDPVISPPFHEYIYMRPREEKAIDGMFVSTMQATQAGVSFLVNVDGLQIFFGGSNAIYEQEMKERFTGEIDYLSEKTTNCDLAFLEFQIGAGDRRPSITEGIWYADRKLAPNVIFPMGAMNKELRYGSPRDPVTYEYLIKDLIEEAPSDEIASKIVETVKPGSMFMYRDGKIVR